MAEKSETLVTKEEKMAEAKELFGRGSRNYCMKQYSDAADDLSACCTIYSELYGPTADECGSVYLLYAKSLIALGKDENNLIVPGEGDEEEDDGDEDGDEGDEEGDGEDDEEGKVADGEKENVPEGEKETKSDSKETAETEKVENKESKVDDTAAAESSSKMEDEPQPGPSTSNGDQQQNEEAEEDEEEKCEGNLEVAWEILELAVKIFEGQGESSLDNLSECYAELASISLENGNFGLAISDYNKALAVYDKTGKSDRRVIAEIHYKIGLCHLMQNEFDESIKAFHEACSEMDNVIQQEKAKAQDDKTAASIKNLEETKQEIMEKIAEVEDTKKTILLGWWSPETKAAVKARRKALRAHKRLPLGHPDKEEAVLHYRRKRNECRDVIRTAKAASWTNFLNGINSNQSASELWGRANALSGKKRLHGIALEEEGNTTTDPAIVAEKLVDRGSQT